MAQRERTEEELAEARREDFQFMVICASKNNMAMYQLLRDHSLDDVRPNREAEMRLFEGG